MQNPAKLLTASCSGTDGIRGVANVPPMTIETAMRLGRAVARLYHRPGHRGRIIIGKDTRLSGYMFEQAMAAGICSMGADVMLCGPLPSAGHCVLTSSMRADAGVSDLGEPQPYYDNGIKICAADGFQAAGLDGSQLEEMMGTATKRSRGLVTTKSVAPSASTTPVVAASCFSKPRSRASCRSMG